MSLHYQSLGLCRHVTFADRNIVSATSIRLASVTPPVFVSRPYPLKSEIAYQTDRGD